MAEILRFFLGASKFALVAAEVTRRIFEQTWKTIRLATSAVAFNAIAVKETFVNIGTCAV
jgi:hypothetical protein